MKEISVRDIESSPRSYVLVDTSVLMLIEERANVLEDLTSRGLKCVVTTTVLRELEKLSKMGGRKGLAARLALKVVQSSCYVLPTEGRKWADEELVDIALRYSVPVATADLELRRKLLRKVPTFYYRKTQRRMESDDYFEI
ncbi:hypothetical protein EYM_04585 [Ignicoccus islandicus DSM 13165]|uniref:VapC9 PIN-like domain-containing protein n=1 Tax=Ignicoccus islandicus DSM 13165 TaxID=940295 RepID=A0A0U3F931_9CREN|nr:PIN domain-containing protein [Ignicoccus islandicus]ALU12504.1 hypothetical protein EYM_04585 [Ignicoccus islandicus DSM 13165]